MEMCRRDGAADPRSGAALDSELLHAGLERRALEAQDPGGAAVAADPPAGLLEHGGDVLAHDLVEASPGPLRPRSGRRRSHDVAEGEAAARRQDDRALDDVLQ